MNAKYYLLKSTLKPQFTNDVYLDAQFISFEGSKHIRNITLESQKINLDEINLSFNLSFDFVPELDMISNNQSWPIFSTRIRYLFSKFNLKYKNVPVTVYGKNGSTSSNNYYAFQIPKNEKLVDLEKSKYEAHPLYPTIFSLIHKLVFLQDNNLPQLFRIKQSPIHLFIQEDLKKELDNINPVGIQIIPLEEYSF